MLLRWPPPRFEMTVLAEGDTTASHVGTRSSPDGPDVSPRRAHRIPDEEVRWLRSNGIDWNGLAS
jgi:hypothetical protein